MTQDNATQHNVTQDNVTQHNVTQDKVTQHNVTPVQFKTEIVPQFNDFNKTKFE